MPAAVENNLFASFRQPAWHGLGNVFEHEVTDSMEMLSLAGLDNWDIRFADIQVSTGEAIETHRAVIRNRPGSVTGEIDVLGIVGGRYGIVNNEEAFAFLQSLNDGALWETAGSLHQGRKVFGSMRVTRDFILDPNGAADAVETYLLVTTTHDGSGNLQGGMTPTRVVCQNTLNVALGNIKNTFKLRHTLKVEDRMAQEAELWRHANTYFDAFETQAQALIQQTVTDAQYFDIVRDIFPQPEDNKKGALTKWEGRQELFAQAWNGEPNAGIKGTGWGAVNALTEANQWGRRIRDNNEENFFAAGAGFDGPTNVFRQTALDRVLSLA